MTIVIGASRLPEREVACRLGSSIIKNASPKVLALALAAAIPVPKASFAIQCNIAVTQSSAAEASGGIHFVD